MKVTKEGDTHLGVTWRKRPCEADFTEDVNIELTPLPCWAHMSRQEYRYAALDLIADIESEHRDLRDSIPKDAKQRLQQQNPTHRPEQTAKSPKPLCHAASKEAWLEYWKSFRDFVNSYRRASDLYRRGVVQALELSPVHSHLPRMGVVALDTS